MKMKYCLISIFTFGFAIAACGQLSAPPPAKSADSGPTLAETMQFIQEKLSQQGQVAWAQTLSNKPGASIRKIVSLGDVMADPAACTLYTTETIETSVDLPRGTTYKSTGKPVNADDLHTQTVETDTTSFKQVEKITVEKQQDIENQTLAEAAHPDVTATVMPPVFYVKMWASSAVFSAHTSTTRGRLPAVEKDATSKTSGFTFRDEDTANRVAKAMTHAMELCGGGVAKKELF
jgi:hypothetical protein